MRLVDGSDVRISFTSNFDNVITQSRGEEVTESACFADCGITHAVPRILRYCFEEQVKLRDWGYFQAINSDEPLEGCDEVYDSFLLDLRLERRGVHVISVGGKLLIHSSICGEVPENGVVFQRQDVPQFLEGVIKNHLGENLPGARDVCIKTVRHYFDRLDKGIIRNL